MHRTRVLLIVGHEVVLVGLRALLERDRSIQIVGATSTARSGLQLAEETAPDVAVIDYWLPDESGLAVCERIAATTGCLILSTDLDDAIVRQVLQAGARGLLHLTVTGRDLRDTVKAVARGESVLDPRVAGRVIAWARGQALRGRTLSRRETEVMRMIGAGVPDGRIADALGLSPNTVKTYLRRSLDKLACASRSEAAAQLGRLGL